MDAETEQRFREFVENHDLYSDVRLRDEAIIQRSENVQFEDDGSVIFEIERHPSPYDFKSGSTSSKPPTSSQAPRWQVLKKYHYHAEEDSLTTSVKEVRGFQWTEKGILEWEDSMVTDDTVLQQVQEMERSDEPRETLEEWLNHMEDLWTEDYAGPRGQLPEDFDEIVEILKEHWREKVLEEYEKEVD